MKENRALSCKIDGDTLPVEKKVNMLYLYKNLRKNGWVLIKMWKQPLHTYKNVLMLIISQLNVKYFKWHFKPIILYIVKWTQQCPVSAKFQRNVSDYTYKVFFLR